MLKAGKTPRPPRPSSPRWQTEAVVLAAVVIVVGSFGVGVERRWVHGWVTPIALVASASTLAGLLSWLRYEVLPASVAHLVVLMGLLAAIAALAR